MVKVYGKGSKFRITHKLSNNEIVQDEDWASRNKAHPDSGETARKVANVYFEHFMGGSI